MKNPHAKRKSAIGEGCGSAREAVHFLNTVASNNVTCAGFDTIIVFSKKHKMYFECVRSSSGLWSVGKSISNHIAMGIPSRVRIETENKPYPSASSTSGAFLVGMPATQRDAYLKELVNRQVRGERLSEEEAWKFYKLQVNLVCYHHMFKCFLA